ncbi:hypothetical protein GGGNBK_21255 [Sporosarcina sp. ANT_H38]|nr:hypothetical protein [Sporosarcina sp. ANT_H38]
MYDGDRMCPDCDTESLVEKGLTQWVCLNPVCESVFETEYLDLDIEKEEE